MKVKLNASVRLLAATDNTDKILELQAQAAELYRMIEALREEQGASNGIRTTDS